MSASKQGLLAHTTALQATAVAAAESVAVTAGAVLIHQHHLTPLLVCAPGPAQYIYNRPTAAHQYTLDTLDVNTSSLTLPQRPTP